MKQFISNECWLLQVAFEPTIFWQGPDVQEIHVSGRLMSTSSEVVYDWILQARGIGIKGSWDVEHDLSTGRLVECLPAYAFDLADLFLVYATKRHLPLRVCASIDFLTERFANRPAIG
jgi:DNA-binding transcriptional LysR family regulator